MTAAPDVFPDRTAAGEALADALATRWQGAPPLVLALPRGGVPVAEPIARRLHAPLDVLVVRKVGMPGQPELAIGAIATGGVVLRNAMVPAGLIDEHRFQALVEAEQRELQRREQRYRRGRGPLDLRDRDVLLVDDGLATGSTMLAAVDAARQAGARTVTVAVPVASREARALLRERADEVVVLHAPAWFGAVGAFYDDFPQVSDAEVEAALRPASAD